MRIARSVMSVTLLIVAAGLVQARGQLSEEEVSRIRDAAPSVAAARPRQPRVLLVFNRAEGYQHSAIPRAAKALELLGKKTGAFKTVQSEDLSVFRPENLQRFDAVCLNNTTQLAFDDPGLRASLLAFVAGGKGIVGIHAATDNFPTWSEGQELFGGVFDGHPWTAEGTWAVMITDPGNPLTAAFQGKDFLVNDEIYRIRQIGLRTNCRVLLALDMKSERNRKAPGVRPGDRDIPISWIRTYGKGRLFYCSLGHNEDVYVNPAVLRHYLDGIQFAMGDLEAPTTPAPFDPMGLFDQQRLDGLLRSISTYRHGDSRASLADLDEFIRSVGDQPEARRRMARQFCEVLGTDATPAGKQFLCTKLALIGSDESVPRLAGMLADTLTAEMALFALEPIPGEAADDALRDALAHANAKTKTGIITALGNRRVDGATKDLELLVKDPDTLVSAAAVSALGVLGTQAALDVLERSKHLATGRPEVYDALLACADRIRVRGGKGRALAVYRDLNGTGQPLEVRCAALRGIVLTDPSSSPEVLREALRSDEPMYRAAAARLVGEVPEIKSTRMIARLLPRLSPVTQIQVLAALSRTRDLEIQTIVLSACGNENSGVRLAALRTIGAIGDGAAVAPLVQSAAASKGTEQKEAREALYGLHGPGVDDTLLSLLPRAEIRNKVELIKAVAERGIIPAVPILLDAAGAQASIVRRESWNALRSLAGPQQVPAMIGLLEQARDDETGQEMELAVAAAARRVSDGQRPEEAVHTAYQRATDRKVRASLINVCGKIGAPSSLPVLRDALNDRDREIRLAAIRALAAWPTPNPFADLWPVATGRGNVGERTLALRGAVRLLGLDSTRAPGETVRLYQEAMKVAPDIAERKALLSAVGQSRSLAGIDMAAGYLDDRNLHREAEAAILNIAEAIGATARRDVVPLLTDVTTSSTIHENRERARSLKERIELYDDYITSWDYDGPYTNEGARLLHEPFGPELPAIQQLRWTPFRSKADPEKPWLLDMSKNVAGEDNVVYLRTNVWSPVEQKVRLELGTDYGVKVWLNGTLVHALDVVRTVAPGDDRVAATLHNGWNVILMKLEQGDGPWRACMRVRDSHGGALRGIRVSTTQG